MVFYVDHKTETALRFHGGYTVTQITDAERIALLREEITALAARVEMERETLDELERALVKKLDALRAWTMRGAA
jgi:hypothetical protein